MKIETPAEKMLYGTVRLETKGPKPDQLGTATAFIFTLEIEGEKHFPCLITNKHVVEGTQVGRFFFTTKKDQEPNVGNRLDIEMDNFEARWYGHPDPEIDVTAMPLAPLLHKVSEMGEEVFYSYISQSSIPTTEQIKELDAIEEVTFVGYPDGIFDTANLLPVFRRGITATPLQIDYNGKPVFLVDASVFPGSSGSPVYIYNLGTYGTRKSLQRGPRIFFLGVIAEVAYRENEGSLEFRSIPTSLVPMVVTKEMIDLGVVFKASTVVETVQGLLSMLKAEGSI
jgi:hypothetical protein